MLFSILMMGCLCLFDKYFLQSYKKIPYYQTNHPYFVN